MPEYTLKIRRYTPESGEAPYWEEFTVELDGHRSVLDGILQAKDREDGSIGIRCSCRAAICGSCGVRINGQPGARLPHAPRRGAGARRHSRDGEPIDGRADGQHAGDQGPDRRHGRGPLEEDPRVTPWLLPEGRPPEREYIVPARDDGRRHADDGLHPVRRLRVGLPVDGGRPAVHRPGRAGQGLPLRRRPARRPSTTSASRTSPRTSTASTTARTASTASRPAPRASPR